MVKNNLIYIILLFLFNSQGVKSQKSNNLHFWLPFDDYKELVDIPYFDHDDRRSKSLLKTQEAISKSDFQITGLAKYVPGVKGYAMKFDGFSSYIEGKSNELPREFTVEAWVSLGAYPWNWAPILTIGKYKITGFYLGVDSRGRIGFHMSDATSVWHECNSIIDPETKLGLELSKWYHVAASYSPYEGIKLYINGELVNTYNDFTFDYGVVYSHLEEGYRLGMNREMLAPTDPIRDWATYPSRYTLDGILDEVKIHGGVLSADDVKKSYAAVKPENAPDFAPRNFPTVKPSGRFAANYTRLEYYPEWDAIWPAGEHLDVVVQFEKSPVKLMFWRGTRYSACWVTENGKWMADQSRETGNNWFLSQGSRDELTTGCIEHMSDIQTRSSRVSIIENTPARITVNWRYLQMDVKFRQLDLPNNTGFGEWGNELYHIYPDGVAVRKILPGRGGWQETIFLNEPGTRPEDNIQLEACILMNLKGESKTYSWEKGYPEFDLEDANIQIINLKSDYKPFIIFAEGGSFDVFNLEVRPEYSHFPWWNHWPVAQIISDGRSASAADRAAHSSLSWGDPGEDFALYGMARDKATVLKIARSWINAPSLSTGTNFNSQGYDQSQRAYIITSEKGGNLKIGLTGSSKSPIYNPAFVVHNWAPKKLEVLKNNTPVSSDKFKYETQHDVEGKPTTIIWIEEDSEEIVNYELKNKD